jgi:hypothetical protein
MAGLGDLHRLKAAEMLAKAEQDELFRKEFEHLAWAFLRIAEQADRNPQVYERRRQPKERGKPHGSHPEGAG